MVKAVNEANPDLLWIGMTAPKQEKWTYAHWDELDIHCHVGTVRRQLPLRVHRAMERHL